MLVNDNSPLQSLPSETLLTIGYHLSFQDLNRVALTGKMGKKWTDSVFDCFAKEILCWGQTTEERKEDLKRLYQLISPNFIKSLNHDIDKLKDKPFINRMLTVEFHKNSKTPFFIMNFASKMVGQVPGGEEIASQYQTAVEINGGWKPSRMLNYYYPPNAKRSGIISAGSSGIEIIQTSSNSICNMTSPKLLEVLKKSCEIYFKKLYENCTIPDLETEKSLPKIELIEKYENKCALVIGQEGNNEFINSHCAIRWILDKSCIKKKVTIIPNQTRTVIYGEKENIQNFIAILYAQQFPNNKPTMATLRKAQGILSPYPLMS